MDMNKWYGKVTRREDWGRVSGRKAKPINVNVDGRTISYEMKVDDTKGLFIAVVPSEGGRKETFESTSRRDLADFLEEFAKEHECATWERYIVVDYSCTAVGDGADHDLEDGTAKRKKRPRLFERVRAIRLDFEIWDYTTEARQHVGDLWLRAGKYLRRRMVRNPDVPADGPEKNENVGYAEWTHDDKVPAGAMPYTRERVAVLEEIQRGLARLDAKMREVLGGAPDELAARLDALGANGVKMLGGGE